MFLPGKSGRKFDHLEQAQKSGALVPELEGPGIPSEYAYLWGVFIELNRERESGIAVQAIKIRDIIGYMQVFGVRLTPFEIECLQCIDQEFLKAYGHSKP